MQFNPFDLDIVNDYKASKDRAEIMAALDRAEIDILKSIAFSKKCDLELLSNSARIVRDISIAICVPVAILLHFFL